MMVDGDTYGVPDDLCSQCRSIAENPDDAENLEQNAKYVLWDHLDLEDFEGGSS
jgi:hypothetical protein